MNSSKEWKRLRSRRPSLISLHRLRFLAISANVGRGRVSLLQAVSDEVIFNGFVPQLAGSAGPKLLMPLKFAGRDTMQM